MKRSCLAVGLLLSSLQGQSVITTIAGTDYVFPRGPMPALQAPLGALDKIAQLPDGSILVADEDNTVVVRIDSSGSLSVFAGNGVFGQSGDGGKATEASLASPFGLALDSSGNVYITERFGCLRKVSPAAIISTVSCNFTEPFGVAVDSKDNIYVASAGSHQIKKVTPSGTVSVVAGTGMSGFSDDGVLALKATLNSPLSVAVDRNDNVYFTEPLNQRVREILPNGALTTVAGGGTSSRDGVQATAAALTPLDVTFDPQGNLFLTDQSSSAVWEMISDGTITRIAGSGGQTYAGDGGLARSASFSMPGGLLIDRSGTLYVGDRGAHRLRSINPATNPASQFIQLVAGNGQFRFSADGGKGVESVLSEPDGLVIDGSGNLLFAEGTANRVRKLSPDGTLHTIAGTGDAGSSGDHGPGTDAELSEPSGLALDQQGNLYIVDSTNARIRKLDPNGVITTFAGNGQNGFSGDGNKAIQAQLGIPTGVAVGPDGSVYIADPQNRRVRRVIGQNIATFAGNGSATLSGDGGPANMAGTPYPFDVAVDQTSGLVYISDNDRIRVVKLDGTISTFVAPEVIGGGPGRLITDASGNVWVSSNNQIFKLTQDRAPTVIAGNGGLPGFGGDGGPPKVASLQCSCGIALDPTVGRVYITDQGNNRVRVILPNPPVLTASSATLRLSGRSTGAPVQAPAVTINSEIPGTAFTATAQDVPWLSVSPTQATAPGSLQIVADPVNLAPGTYLGTILILSSFSGTSPLSIQVTFEVDAAQPAGLAVNTASLPFSFLQGDKAAAQTLFISNGGDGAFAFQVSASTDTGSGWLSLNSTTGSVRAGFDSPVAVTADPTGLKPGTYTGHVTVSNLANPAQTRAVPVSMIVNPVQRTLLLSQYGFTFTAVEGGPSQPGQTFGVLNTGQGLMSWSAQLIGSPSAAQWLSVTPATGVTDAASLVVPFVQVNVSTTGLAKGTYYGGVAVKAKDAGNSPQIVTVVLNVLPKGSNPGLLVRPTGLIFTGVAGQSPPGSQEVLVTNLSSTPVSYISGHLPSDPGNWFFEHPSSGTLMPGEPFPILIVPTGPIFSSSVRGSLTILPNDTHFSPQVVDLLRVSIPAQHSNANVRAKDVTGSTCSPLIPIFSQVNSNIVVAGWPNALEVNVVDSCGAALIDGAVTVSFSNGDPPVSMAPLKDGRWAGTWTPRSVSTQVTLTATAVSSDQSATGTATFAVNGVQTNDDAPVVQPGNVVTAADPLVTGTPVAPGSVISIFGTHFSDSSTNVADPPFDTQLNETAVLMGTTLLPVSAVTPTRIDAVVPFDASVDARQQIVILRGATYSSPETVTVSSAQPAIYSSDNTGAGPGLIYRIGPDDSRTLASTGNPARAGETIAIRCTGLGPVDRTLQAGSPAPTDPPVQVIGDVSVLVGSTPIAADSATLVPGKAGVYEVKATLPSLVDTGDAVNIVVVVNGQSSQGGITLAIAQGQ